MPTINDSSQDQITSANNFNQVCKINNEALLLGAHAEDAGLADGNAHLEGQEEPERQHSEAAQCADNAGNRPDSLEENKKNEQRE